MGYEIKGNYCYVESDTIGEGTTIWNHVHIRNGAKIGNNCNIGDYVYIGKDVKIGDNCKIQNFACIYEGVKIGNNVFIGPHVCFTNDLYPKVIGNWNLEKTIIQDGVSIGANSTILCGITIGESAMIGAGSVVTDNVKDGSLIYGNPAKYRRKILDDTNS